MSETNQKIVNGECKDCWLIIAGRLWYVDGNSELMQACRESIKARREILSCWGLERGPRC